MSQMKVFVSHSSADAAFCRELVTALREQGADVWYDESSLGAGYLSESIMVALSECPVFIVALSKAAFASEWVYEECFLVNRLVRQEPSLRKLVPVTVTPISEEDFRGKWLFLGPYKRVEAPGCQPLPSPEAIAQTLELAGVKDPYWDLAHLTVKELLSQGRALREAKQNSEAIRYFLCALRHESANYSAWFNLGWAYENLQRYAEELDAYQHALDLRPTDPYAAHLVGFALSQLGRLKEALVAYDYTLTLKRDRPKTWANRAEVLNGLRRHAQALESADEAQRLDPGYLPAKRERAIALDGLGEYEAAIAQCDELLSLRSSYVQVRIDKGLTLHHLGRDEEALATLNGALALDHNRSEIWAALADVHRALGQEQEARMTAKRARELRG